MNQKQFYIIPALFLSILIGSCSQNWTKTIRHGKTIDSAFNELVKTEINNKLIIVPVSIKGESYRFLFDTGAMLSISEELQKKFNYKTLSKGHILDSDNNRQKVKYVEIDTLHIGQIPFMEQTAFVGNFKKNPAIECLKIDGIIGSNLMRFCNWTIDYQNAEISLFNTSEIPNSDSSFKIPFRTDNQFSQIIEMEFGKAKLKNLKIDYGSNRSLTISNSGFKVLKDNSIINNTYTLVGFSQSGISGKVISVNRERAFADTLKAGNLSIPGVEIKTGKSGLVGTEILSRFVVTIDFLNKKLFLIPVADVTPDYSTYGFGVGYSEDKQMYVQWVIENSPATEQGIIPGQQIIKIDHLDFSKENNLCDFIQYSPNLKENLKIEIQKKNGEKHTLTLKKRLLYEESEL